MEIRQLRRTPVIRAQGLYDRSAKICLAIRVLGDTSPNISLVRSSFKMRLLASCKSMRRQQRSPPSGQSHANAARERLLQVPRTCLPAPGRAAIPALYIRHLQVLRISCRTRAVPSDRKRVDRPMALRQTPFPRRVAVFRNRPCNLSPNASARASQPIAAVRTP